MTRDEFELKIFSLNDKIFRFAKSLLTSDSEAEDVVQDIFEKVWVIRDKVDTLENVDAFVFRSVKNLCYDKLRHRKMKQTHISGIGKESYAVSVEQTHTEESDMHKMLMEAIAQLPAKQRLVIHMRDIEGYEFEEIAQVAESDVEAVRVNLSRARKNVKEKIIKIMNHGL